MADYTNEQLIEMYHKLPKDVQEAILSVDTSNTIREIGEKHKLMIDKIGDLADETGLVMLGLTHPGQYVSHLIERLGIDREAAQEITEEVNNRILFPIRDSLRKIQEEREATAEVPEIIKSEISAEETKPEEPLPVGPPIAEEKTAPEMPSPADESAFETATLTPPPLAETPASPPVGLPMAPSADGEPAIFQAKTKEEIFRLPLQTVEKTPEPQKPASSLGSPEKRVDPYREPIS